MGGKNALLGSKIWAGGGSKDSWGEERRGEERRGEERRGEGGQKKNGVERGGEERIHCWKPNSCVKLSGHGHTPQILVLLEWVKWKCIIHSLIINYESTKSRIGVRGVKCASQSIFLLRIHITYFISLFDLRVCNKLLVIPKSWDSRNKEHDNAHFLNMYYTHLSGGNPLTLE